LPVEEVDEVVEVKPEVCGRCGHPLVGSDSAPVRHQVTDVPPVVARTTEYRLHTLACPECGEQTRAELPEGVSRGRFGARVQGMVAVLSGAYRLSKRNIVGILQDFFGVKLSLGTVSALEEAASEALEGVVEEVRGYVKQQFVVNVDETGWKEGNTLRLAPPSSALIVRKWLMRQGAAESSL